MQARALVKERAQRNLLLVIDGIKTDEMLLANMAGITADDFAALQSLGLIAPVAAAGARSGGAPWSNRVAAPASAPAADPLPLDYGQFTQALTQMISKELGLRGFVLTLAVEKAGTIEELQAICASVRCATACKPSIVAAFSTASVNTKPRRPSSFEMSCVSAAVNCA